MESRAFIGIILGAVILFWPGRISDRASKKHEERLATLREGAVESYFEERRALEAYKPLRIEVAWRLLGIILICGSAWQVYR
jgi:hypothetical protein